MKLAASIIAWPADLDAAAFTLLAAGGVGAIEVAPTRVWPQWKGINSESARAFRSAVESSGLSISSLQSVLFQKPELRLFGSDQDRQAMYEHLCRCADLTAELGADCMVFGAPKNRTRGALSEENAFAIAVEFFCKAGEYCAQREVCVGFEANPEEYGCDFATDSRTAARLVRAAGSRGFRLHLDTACLHLAGEDPSRAIADNIDILRHFHVSEPYLGGFSAPSLPHGTIAQTLRRLRYDRWVTVEMRAVDGPLSALEEAIRFVGDIYGDREHASA